MIDESRPYFMKALVQRVESATVRVEDTVVGEISQGYLVFLGVTHDDRRQDAEHLAKKTLGLRIFEDEAGKMNLNISTVSGQVLVVSQFTLYANTRKGNRPSFVDAAAPAQAEELYQHYIQQLRSTLGDSRVACGLFGAEMKVSLLNDGPVTIELQANARGEL